MRPLFLFAAVLCFGGHFLKAQISPQTASEILDRLEKLKKISEENAKANLLQAISRLRTAASTPSDAVNFYIESVRQVNFEESERSQSEFREWRKQNEQRNRDSSFRRAIQLQITWLQLSLRSTLPEANLTELAQEATRLQNELQSEADKLFEYRDILSRSVLDTEMARALRVHATRLQNWPNNLLDIPGIYSQIIIPPLRQAKDVRGLRDAWQKRIDFQEKILTNWSGSQRRQLRQYLIEERPQIIWEMHKDLFQAGDANNAARAMLAHIQENATHPRVTGWINELSSMLKQASQNSQLGKEAEELSGSG